mmetsp:Transcript_77137/g.249712  ORF Transcript_77137/g.249712 Transcript_77137/m.249712 type:complete len:390 (+) Transcript_77137:1578-2747(+)
MQLHRREAEEAGRHEHDLCGRGVSGHHGHQAHEQAPRQAHGSEVVGLRLVPEEEEAKRGQMPPRALIVGRGAPVVPRRVHHHSQKRDDAHQERHSTHNDHGRVLAAPEAQHRRVADHGRAALSRMAVADEGQGDRHEDRDEECLVANPNSVGCLHNVQQLRFVELFLKKDHQGDVERCARRHNLPQTVAPRRALSYHALHLKNMHVEGEHHQHLQGRAERLHPDDRHRRQNAQRLHRRYGQRRDGQHRRHGTRFGAGVLVHDESHNGEDDHSSHHCDDDQDREHATTAGLAYSVCVREELIRAFAASHGGAIAAQGAAARRATWAPGLFSAPEGHHGRFNLRHKPRRRGREGRQYYGVVLALASKRWYRGLAAVGPEAQHALGAGRARD